jgi:hypothetical protein
VCVWGGGGLKAQMDLPGAILFSINWCRCHLDYDSRLIVHILCRKKLCPVCWGKLFATVSHHQCPKLSATQLLS